MTHQSRLMRRGFSGSALLALALALAAAIGPAAAEKKVGVAAAVNPDAFSSLAGAPKSQLNIGKSIFFNERIATTTSGLVQVLLVDGSTFTVGPDSDLVIDKFVYDPNKGTGQIAASFSKGVMRFVGGKISKSDNAVTINTPAGAMAVRGCIILTQVTPSNFSAVLVYGDYLKMKNFVVYEPGNGVFISPTGAAEVRKATTADIGNMVAGLSNNNTQNQNGDASGKTSNPGTVIQLVDTANLSELIQNANTQEVLNSPKTPENQPPVVPPVDVAPPCESDCEGTPAGHLTGYAAGNYVTADPGNYEGVNADDQDRNVEYGTVGNHRASEVDFAFNDDGETFSASHRLHVSEPGAPSQGGILINYGDAESDPEEPSSFINPDTGGLLALTGRDGITVFRDGDVPAPPLGDHGGAVLVSSDFFGPPQGPPGGVSTHGFGDGDQEPPPVPTLCTDCSFMKWGVFLASAGFDDSGNSEHTNPRQVAILGWWVAGDIPNVNDLPFKGTATYSGGAVGTVTTNLFGEGPTTYVAKGDMNMDWNFGKRTGNMEISKFDQQNLGGDGLTVKGKMCAPGVSGCGGSTPSGNHFGGKINGQLPNSGPSAELPADARNLDGFALGSFARGPDNFDNGDPKTGKPIKGSTPQGTMGNWQVGNDHYKASGVFAGKRN